MVASHLQRGAHYFSMKLCNKRERLLWEGVWGRCNYLELMGRFKIFDICDHKFLQGRKSFEEVSVTQAENRHLCHQTIPHRIIDGRADNNSSAIGLVGVNLICLLRFVNQCWRILDSRLSLLLNNVPSLIYVGLIIIVALGINLNRAYVFLCVRTD